MDGVLKSIYFEPLGPFPYEAHKALVDALSAYGPAKMVFLPYNDQRQTSRQIRQSIEEFRPDLVIFGYLGNLDLADLSYLHQNYPDTFLVNYIADVVTIWDGLFDVTRAFDWTIVSSPSDFPAFAAHGLEVGFFPGWTQHQYVQAERGPIDGPDVVFIGSLYFENTFPGVPFRRETVQAMAASGLHFELYGQGWERAGVTSLGGTYGQYTRNAQIYARAKMGLSVDDVRHKYCCCSDRPYNIAATGCMVLTSSFPGMEWNGWVDGETCAVFDTTGEMLDKARYYLAHEEEREAIGRAGREMTRARHTWDARIEALWAMLERIGGQHD